MPDCLPLAGTLSRDHSPIHGLRIFYILLELQNININMLRENMVIYGTTCYKCKVNTAHQMELFVFMDCQETEW